MAEATPAPADATAAATAATVWRAEAGRILRGRPISALRRDWGGGVTLEPLYDRVPETAALPLATRAQLPAAPWQIRARIARGDAAEVARQIERAAASGAHAVTIAPASPGARGARLAHGADVRAALAPALRAGLPVYVEAGASVGPWLAARLVAAEAADGDATAAKALAGGVLASPLATLAAEGCLAAPLAASIADLAQALTLAPFAGLDLVSVSALPAHDAGASAATAVASVLAQLSELARLLERHDVAPSSWLARTWIDVGVDGDVLASVAMLRALRAVHARFSVALGAPIAPARIHAHCTRRSATRHDAPTNLLRATADGTAAAIGGADAITLPPYDVALGGERATAARLALTMQAVLQREGHLGRVVDPCAGAYEVETATDAVARAAFACWQAIEAEGGWLAALRSGWLQRRVAGERAAVEGAVARRELAIVGVSVSPTDKLAAAPDGGDEVAAPIDAEPVDGVVDVASASAALHLGASMAAIEASLARVGSASEAAGTAAAEVCAPLRALRWATGWESLRERVAGLGDAAPAIFLATIGPIPRHKARLDFARELFTAGGFRVVEGPAGASLDATVAAFPAAGCDAVAICGADADYADAVPTLVAELDRYAPRFVAVMGRPPHEGGWSPAGVTHFAHLGADALGTLTDCAARCGVGEGGAR